MRLKKENRVSSVVETSLKNLTTLVDVNTVVGTPFYVESDCIIPVSKVTFASMSGGGEYGKITIFKSSEDLPFSAGNGAIISVKPCGFLVKEKGKEYKMVYCEQSPCEKIVEKASEIITELQKTE